MNQWLRLMLNGNEQLKLDDLNASIECGLDSFSAPVADRRIQGLHVYATSRWRKDCIVDSSPFPTALIAYSLGFSDSPKARAMLTGMIAIFSWGDGKTRPVRYWTRKLSTITPFRPIWMLACISACCVNTAIDFPTNLKLIMAIATHSGCSIRGLTRAGLCRLDSPSGE